VGDYPLFSTLSQRER